MWCRKVKLWSIDNVWKRLWWILVCDNVGRFISGGCWLFLSCLAFLVFSLPAFFYGIILFLTVIAELDWICTFCFCLTFGSIRLVLIGSCMSRKLCGTWTVTLVSSFWGQRAQFLIQQFVNLVKSDALHIFSVGYNGRDIL